MSNLLLLAVPVIFFVMLVMPQRQRAKRQRALVSSLGVGQRVVTVGGIVGTVTSTGGTAGHGTATQTIRLEVCPGTEIEVMPQAVARQLPQAPADEAPADEAPADGTASGAADGMASGAAGQPGEAR
ncbi:MAG: preprotein translocase subunit YajC [Acidimicrobiales bacterium]